MSLSRDPAARLVLVTGPSGAGRSTAIAALEDLGYEAIDNMPVSLIPRLLSGEGRPLALGLDARNRDFEPDRVAALIEELTDRMGMAPDLLYLDCRTDVLLRRFSETRRRHPLSQGDGPDQGLAREAELLAPLMPLATDVLDTSELSPHELKAEIAQRFSVDGHLRLALSVVSFSYKHGLPRGADVVFDCRFLRNPHWDAALRPLTGRDAEVADYVAADPRHAPFQDKALDLLTFLLPAVIDEGKAHFTAAFGCTGGRHRSVMMAEAVAAGLAEGGWQVSVRHRDLDRQGRATARATSGLSGARK
ncbi:RNase adapter RapZ [Pseudaestuariivita sp.]|uniref:RNase adapter RapZ n=1 Tax=Pseudaestuariivita sp. TaxID=2211669 RepID=UPI00405860BC